MSQYLKQYSTRQTPQSEPIPGSGQVPNSAGGYSFQVDDFALLDRFLILGNEGGSYYAGEREMTVKNAECVSRCLDADAVRTIDRVVEVSVQGRAPKNDPAIFVIALGAAHSEVAVRRYALAALSRVCRTGTHLFTFLAMVQQHRGWGRSLRGAVAEWYLGKSPRDLAYQLVKYRQRNEWTHRDALRLAHTGHPNSGTEFTDASALHQAMFDWVTHRDREGYSMPAVMEADELDPITAYKAAQRAESSSQIVRLIEKYGGALPREAIPSEYLADDAVWAALFDQGMPMTALIRNLATLTARGVLKPLGGERLQRAVEQITDETLLQRARVHPVSVLMAMRTYQAGHGMRGSQTWTPVAQIVDALEAAFMLAFRAVEPTGKRHMLCLDVSGSMAMSGRNVADVPRFTPREASAAMAMVTAWTEPQYHVMGFCDRLTPLSVTASQSLTSVVRTVSGLPFGGTDCSLPMLYAQQAHLEVDAFVVYTDNETWAGRIHPSQALKQYRESTGIDAKLIVNGMVANEFSIADPRDPGMLDVVGFDSATPQVMAEFVR